MTPMQATPFEEEDEGIDMAQYSQQQQEESNAEDEEGTINMAEYADSPEAEEASWWDAAKEAGIQSIAGLSQAYTWPLDVLKVMMIGEGLTDIDDLEDAFARAGKEFDRDKYVKTVMEQGQFLPTQALLERTLDEQFGTNIEEPKTKTGKFFNKLFFLGGLTRGKGWGKAIKAGVVGAGTTAALREAGAPEIVSELAGDVTGGIATIEKQARKLSPEAKRIVDIADKHGLPLIETMLKDEISPVARITPGRKAAFEKDLGMTTEEAIQKVIEDKIPLSKLRSQGKDLEVLETEAYDQAKALAKSKPNPINTKEIVSDIDREIARIKSLAPSPSDAQQAAIRILEKEKKVLGKSKANAEQLITQTQNYNSNVKSIYKKAEFSGVEDEVKNAYAFLNGSIRNTIEKEAGAEITNANKAANKIFAQNSSLARTEGMVNKAFQNGEYSAKKLHQVLNSKQGAVLRRDIGEQGVKELRDIAEFGQKAQKATSQFANSAKHKFQIGEWGPLAGFLLATAPKAGIAAVSVKPFTDYVRGYILTRPASRTVYRNIIKNASNGSFSNMAKDFSILESQIIEDFGSMEEFMKQGVRELQMYREGEEED
jgi:hypothetical protein